MLNLLSRNCVKLIVASAVVCMGAAITLPSVSDISNVVCSRCAGSGGSACNSCIGGVKGGKVCSSCKGAQKITCRDCKGTGSKP